MSLCKKILVIEDNEDIREAITSVLSDEGYDTDFAVDGRAGLEKLRKYTDPTLVLVDLMMPSMNGWEFLDEQKKITNPLGHKFVTVSAVAATQSMEDPTPLDTDGAIKKPIRLEELWATVTKYCGTAENHKVAKAHS
ncbi:MAG: response regulator [Bdellovibrionota bacterium]